MDVQLTLVYCYIAQYIAGSFDLMDFCLSVYLTIFLCFLLSMLLIQSKSACQTDIMTDLERGEQGGKVSRVQEEKVRK